MYYFICKWGRGEGGGGIGEGGIVKGFLIFRSEAPLQLTLSVCLSVCSSVCTPSALLCMEIAYIIHNDSLLFLGNEPWERTLVVFICIMFI